MKRKLLSACVVLSSLAACAYPAYQYNYGNPYAPTYMTPPVTFYNPPLEAVSIVPVAKMQVEFMGDKWDGKAIPGDEICIRQGGRGHTPPLRVRNIPNGTDFLLLEFNDATNFEDSYDGALGKIGVWHDGTAELHIPPIFGETNKLPSFAFAEKLHEGEFSKGVIYMPPCNSGPKHDYFMKIKAVDLKKTNSGTRKIVLDEFILPLGKH